MSVIVEKVGDTVVVRFARPPANAFDLPLVEELAARLDEIDAAPPPGGVVVTGRGSAFSGGVDFKEVPGYAAAEKSRMVQAINRTITTLYGLPTATVAAVNGYAIGGAFVVMLACDTRIAVATDAKLGLTEVTAGIPYPACPMEVVRAELAPADRRVLVMTGAIVTPAQALAHGIVDELVSAERLVERAVALAKSRAAHRSYARVKAQLKRRTLDRMRAIVASGSDPMLDHWV